MGKIKDLIIEQKIKKIVSLLSDLSDENLIRLTKIAKKIDREGLYTPAIERFKKAFEEKEPALELAKDVLKNLSKNCRNKLVVNFFMNTGLKGAATRIKLKKELGFKPPHLLVIDVTMKCNLRCKGCWAGEYAMEKDIDFETLDRLFTQAKELGTYFFVITGGEPFVRKDMMKIYAKHDDAYFMIYTNGTLIDKSMAKRLAELGNVALCLSIEGFEKETDERRGKGTFRKVMQAMDYLREEGVLFGFSATPTKTNPYVMYSDKFLDLMIAKGCKLGWYFTYIPIGRCPDISLMQTPEQRTACRKRLETIRATKPIFLGDFWNDGHYVKGCIAGGRNYLHITNKGDIEPCVFIHFAIDNIKNKPLKEALDSKLFRAIRKRQPFSKNHWTPCMIIDNPQMLREIYDEVKPYSTHQGAEIIVKDKKIREHLDKYSKRMHDLTDKEWDDYEKRKQRVPADTEKVKQSFEGKAKATQTA